jgi:DnaJ-class molecular chaperone
MSDSCDLYRVLGLSKDASQDDIRSAFKKLALQHHPDKKGGDDTEFKRINEAYQILSDVDKRKVYDMKYEDNINIDLLSKFASILMNIVHDKLKEKVASQKTSCHTNNEHTYQKARPIRLNITVDVEEVYNAKVKKMVVKVKRRVDDGSFVFKSKTLYISLLNYRDEYIFEGQGDDGDVVNARGDIIVKLDIKSDNPISVDTLFCKHDLHMECKMSLYEYLYGFDVKLPYFNGDVIHVDAQPSKREYLQDDGYYNYVHEMNGKGLPYVDGDNVVVEDEDNIKRGKLFIYFKLFLDKVPEDKLLENEIFFRTYFNGAKD